MMREWTHPNVECLKTRRNWGCAESAFQRSVQSRRSFCDQTMAHALRSTSLFSRILTSSTRPYGAAAASSKRALATAAHEHDDAGELFFPHFTPVLVPFPFPYINLDLVARCNFENPRRIFQNAVNLMWISRQFISKVRENFCIRVQFGY